MTEKTIAALSTPAGRGGVALLRLSGPEAFAVAGRVFRPRGERALGESAFPEVRFGSIYEGETLLDTGILTLFKAPHSYTGEDVAELSCHGGLYLSRRILEALYAAGATPAGPGEFTKRAFLSGKLGLSEAEAVMDLIDAENEAQLRIAAANATGALGGKIKKVYDELAALLAAAYVCGDYPDEDLADLTPGEMRERLESCLREAEALRRSYRQGHAVTEGVPCAIVGRPNVGKSSLLNALLGRERAIVSSEEGTTRDTVEESCYLGEVRLRLIDTAGLRRGEGDAENQGIRRTLEAIDRAELLLGVLDASLPADPRDGEVLARLRESGKPCLLLLNKSDAGAALDPADYPDFAAVLPVSARTGEGLSALRETVEKLYLDEKIADPSVTPVIASARQFAALEGAAAAMENALRALRSGFTPDVAGLDIEAAMAALLEVDGRAALDSVVDSIFHRFCVGK